MIGVFHRIEEFGLGNFTPLAICAFFYIMLTARRRKIQETAPIYFALHFWSGFLFINARAVFVYTVGAHLEDTLPSLPSTSFMNDHCCVWGSHCFVSAMPGFRGQSAKRRVLLQRSVHPLRVRPSRRRRFSSSDEDLARVCTATEDENYGKLNIKLTVCRTCSRSVNTTSRKWRTVNYI